MMAVWGVCFRLTFWELSWDVMEPITYFIGSGTGNHTSPSSSSRFACALCVAPVHLGDLHVHCALLLSCTGRRGSNRHIQSTATDKSLNVVACAFWVVHVSCRGRCRRNRHIQSTATDTSMNVLYAAFVVVIADTGTRR